MAEEFTVRVQFESGMVNIRGLTLSSPVSELKRKIGEALHFPIGTFDVLAGYPPLSLQRDNVTLEEAGIYSGEVLRVTRPPPHRSPSNVQLPALPVLDSSALGDLELGQLGNPFQGGTMMRIEVPANNSCLFVSMHYLLTGGKLEPRQANNLRALIANAVASDPERYNDVVLGMSNADYCTWIQNPTHWGGGIELSILSDHYGIEVVAVDVKSLAFMKFGEFNNYVNRVFLLYDGIHYEPLVLDTGAEDGLKQTLFATNDEYAVVCVKEVAQEANASRQFVDLTNFALVCEDCGTGLRGEREAREHAAVTRHAHFNEVHDAGQ